MTEITTGRLAATFVTENPGSVENVAGLYSWNLPKQAVNPYLDSAEVAPESALSNLITLYAADNEQEHLRREALSDKVWERYFFNESRDPVQREMEQDRLISHAKMAREQQRINPDLVIIADVSAAPAHISKPLLERIKYFNTLGRPKAYSRYLRETIRPCIDRLERVRDCQMSASFRFMASHDGLEGLLVLPEMNQDQVKRLSTLVAAHMSMCLDAACGDLFVSDDVKPEEIRQAWERVAAEAMRLEVIPPAFEQLRRKKRRRKPVPYELIPPSLARMLCADWWYRKLWQMRCEWREEQLRAVCLVNKKASPYVSYEAVIHKREQRRKSLEFFRSHELINEDGDTLDMEDVVNASNSNPAHRRNEMMACVKGLELIAEMRGDCAVFYTITCPSRFHATLNNGRPNPKWTSATVRQSSDYLVDTFAAFRKAMHKAGLRWYGVRVAEPHHDGTVHWHLLCFMRKKDRRSITAMLRKFAIREDREELGTNTGPRFKSELINPRKGTPTSYIAKYISKNIDGRGLAKEISKETGRSLRDSAEHVSAWASLHRVQQFRFFGIPGRQAYRELRLLAGQAARVQGERKAGAPVLDNPRLDAVLAAADAGCFATYIMKQGGVLVPRKHHLVRTAYELNDEPSAYGDHGIRIYGIWSPIVEGKICTHAMKWKKVRKAVDVQEAAADQGACAPWTRGNNCPPVENVNKSGGDLPDIKTMDEKELQEYLYNMGQKERRELTARLRLVKPKRKKTYKQNISEKQRLQLEAELSSRGFNASDAEVDLLLRGGSIPSGAGLRIFYRKHRLQEDDKWRQWY
ncbi:replication endonuclease [Salmonella enterica subsp. enterica serovar Cerro]|uniref:Replication endonuclease n=1 Tax=Salmonella enterica TaxID=28901 RepID=A0A5T3RUK7_SALER|nr:replication endonuclease [Salmonella enterica subsp. enterica serovar Cerro]EAM1335500.1 replication endonuclease [Salmonella enterica]EBI0452990.1 replication endonuclease [Salmonella enterica subsp. enterica serovar Mbandaka]ECA2347029.1 replication endonuclease [Salmonella enterica subsp. enterica serovar Corvallis]ECD5811449.1 replication endonuclease [Salmonella enterica subsp. enterica serovar Haifa]EDS7222389.1 replication endonuclease [Salmonella enterica subsp. enterica serovar Gol